MFSSILNLKSLSICMCQIKHENMLKNNKTMRQKFKKLVVVASYNSYQHLTDQILKN